MSRDIELELQPGYPVRLVLDSNVTLPDPPVYIKATLSTKERPFGFGFSEIPPFDESREIIVNAPQTGPLTVMWVLEQRSVFDMSTPVLFKDPQVVEVDGVEGQRIDVTLTDEQLEKLLSSKR